MKRIVYTRPDGGISIVNPSPNAPLATENEDEFIARILAKDVPADAVDVQIVEDTAVLSDRTFRNAWRQTAGVILVDLPAARAIHSERMANAQTAEIGRLKVEERRERLLGNTTQADQHATNLTALEALDLNALATQIQAAPNPTALSAVWPSLLPRPT